MVPVGRTIADGQQLDTPGERTFAVVRERVAAVVTVSDAEIVAAMRFAFERLKLVLEPSGASALAALLHGKVECAGLRTGVILSGGNVDVDALPRADGPRLSSVRTAILTVSTSVANRASEDRSGPVLAALAEAAGCEIIGMEVVPDDFALIEDRLHHFVDRALRPDLHDRRNRHDARRHHSRGDARGDPSRGARAGRGDARGGSQAHAAGDPDARVAGIAEATLIVNFPGSPQAVEQLFPVIAPVLDARGADPAGRLQLMATTADGG